MICLVQLALAQTPGHEAAEALVNKGNDKALEKRFKAAIKLYSQALKKDAAYAMAYEKRAEAYQAIKKFSLAISDYTTAIKFNHNLAAAYRGRAYTEVLMEDYKDAINDYDEAIRLHEKDTFSFFSASHFQILHFRLPLGTDGCKQGP